MFSGVPHTAIDVVWPEVLPWIGGACSRNPGKYQPEDIRQALLARDMQLWVYRDAHGIAACCVTEIVDYPCRRYARILIGTGRNRSNWQGYRKIIEEWARAQGCSAIESFARKGWARVFDDYRQTHVMLEKEL